MTNATEQTGQHAGTRGSHVPGAVSVLRNEQIDDAAWDAYAAGHAQASIYHTTAWRRVIERAFGKQLYYLASCSGAGRIGGLLPLVRLNGPFLPDMLISIPYCNYGGVLADSAEDRGALFDAAFAIADELGCDLTEIRSADRLDVESLRPRGDKIGMMLDLPESPDALAETLGSKRRSQIKRCLREGPDVRWGHSELIGDFYSVFARKMHELGTPVYPRRFFERVCDELGERARVLVIRLDGGPVAAAFLVGWRDTLEIPWAAADSAYNRQAVNMYLYWQALERAIVDGYARFDFGRSTKDSGTYKFKSQWGAEPTELAWYTRSRRGRAHGPPGESRTMQLAVKAWKRLPLSVANLLGPRIASNLPW